jgi:hypothetical protein
LIATLVPDRSEEPTPNCTVPVTFNELPVESFLGAVVSAVAAGRSGDVTGVVAGFFTGVVSLGATGKGFAGMVVSLDGLEGIVSREGEVFFAVVSCEKEKNGDRIKKKKIPHNLMGLLRADGLTFINSRLFL